jgi:DNA-binding MarR family transcriptional regulator
MPTTTADRILAHLTRLAARTTSRKKGAFQPDDVPPTAKEIAEAIGANPSTVTTALRRLEYLGKVRQVGEAFGGGRTWTLTDQGQ